MEDMDAIDRTRATAPTSGCPSSPRRAASDTYGGQKGHVLTMVKKELLRLGFSEEEINGGGLR